MSQYNFEGQSDGDWEDRGDLSWSEQDWQLFLKRRESEIVKFLRLYDTCPSTEVQRLDWVASHMKWDAEDWSVLELENFVEDVEDAEVEPEEDLQDQDPYTLHRHPVFVVTIGLFTQIRYLWRRHLQQLQKSVDPVASWDLSDSLCEAERHCLLGMQSMEMGDYLLCIIHFKRCLRGINLAMGKIPLIGESCDAPQALTDGMRDRLFDIREVALRVMDDCRESERGDFLDGE